MNNIKLNKTLYPTWNFLRVNEKNIDISLPTLKPYNMELESLKGVNINKLDDNLTNYSEYINHKYEFGVSGDIVNYTKENFNSGYIIEVEEGERITSPIKLSYKLHSENMNLADYNIILARENSEVTIIIDYSSEEEIKAFHSGVTKVFSERGSVVNLIKVQRLNENSIHLDSNLSIVKGRGSVRWINIEIGSKVNITNYMSDLLEYKSDSRLYSGYFLDGERVQDIYHSMIHRGQGSTSIMDVKGIIKDYPKKTYKGVVDFRKGSKGSRGEQSEDVTLLNKGIKVDSVPMLLSGEENVEGAHAASLGQVDEGMLFYIMSRGLSEKEAKMLLVKAKFKSVLSKIPDENLVNEINNSIERRLRVYGI